MIHALAGLPRSGSTLLANVLAQHPDVHVSGTSALASCVEQVQRVLTDAPEIQSDLANVPGSYDRYLASLRGLCDGWYADRDEATIVDKGRGWVMFPTLLAQLYPNSALVVCVRDPRDVLASIERQHRATALFGSPVAPTVYEAAERLMVPDGLVGGPIRFIEDLIRRNIPAVYVRYETFVADPATTVDRVAGALDLSAHTWDFENVTNQASDLDALYRNKYPHDGSGPIKPSGRTWQDTLDPQLAGLVASRYPLFMQTFAYT